MKATEKHPSVERILLDQALEAFNDRGFDRVTVADLCSATGVSNGSFFHRFRSKEVLGAEIYLDALKSYHRNMMSAVANGPAASDGIATLVGAHINWVEEHRAQARFLFELTRSEWLEHIRTAQDIANAELAMALDAWRSSHIEAGRLRAMPMAIFISQLIGPAQILCRAWLSGRSDKKPGEFAGALVECAIRSICIGAA